MADDTLVEHFFSCGLRRQFWGAWLSRHNQGQSAAFKAIYRRFAATTMEIQLLSTVRYGDRRMTRAPAMPARARTMAAVSLSL